MPFDIKLPENCAVRLIDMDVHVRALLSSDEEGFFNIYVNARLSRDEQLKALRHELKHIERGDLYSDQDIRAAERETEESLRAMDGEAPSMPRRFRQWELRPVGRGLYRPSGEGVARAEEDIRFVSALLEEAVQTFDVLQRPPLVSAERLFALIRGLGPEDIAFVAFPREAAAVTHLYREPGDLLRGAVYYDAWGRIDNALFIAELRGGCPFRLTVDLRRRRGRLALHALSREIGGASERLYFVGRD